MSGGGACAKTLTDETRTMTLDEWILFLEPDIATGKGAAICMSSQDYQETKTALQQACYKLGRWCTKEIKEEMMKTDARVMALQEKVRGQKRERRRKNPL